MKKTFNVQWMHCASCELLLESQISDLNWVKIKKVSSKSWELIVDIKHPNLTKTIEKIITDNWYKLANKATKKEKQPTAPKKNLEWWLEILAIVIMWVVVFFLLRELNIYKAFDIIWGEINVRVALLMWVVASLSTCLVVTGSVVLWFAEYADKSQSKKWQIKTQLSFQIGRILWFAILWWFLWLIWKTIQISVWVSAFLTILVWIVILYMWLNMLWFVPNITKLGLKLPNSRTKNILTTKNPNFAPIVGALTFFLPCGFTQSMQLLAISGWGFWQWALIMWAFAIWTAPVLFGVGMSWEYIKQHKYSIVTKIIAVLIVFFGLFSMSNGWWLINTQPTTNQPEIEIDISNIDYELIQVWHDGRNMDPEVVKLKAGWSYEIVITPDSNGIWCMSTMLIPKISKDVHRIIKGEEIRYYFTNIKKWKYNVVCSSMWMYQWSFVVE